MDSPGFRKTHPLVLGAAGSEIEKDVKKHYSYRVTVRMDDGSFRTLSQSTTPAVAVGARVRVADGSVIARS